MNWTLTKKLEAFVGLGEISRMEVSPEEIKSREVELGLKVGFFFAPVVSQRWSYGRCLCD